MLLCRAQPEPVGSTVFMPCTAFEALGLQQPFSLSLYSNVLLLMVGGAVCV